MKEENKISSKQNFIQSSKWLYIFSFALAPIGYIIKIILSEALTTTEYGILYGIISFFILIGAYNDLGISESLKYFLPKFIEKKDFNKVKTVLFWALISQLLTSFILIFFFYFGAEFLANNYFKTSIAVDLLKIMSIYFLGINLLQITTNFYFAITNTFLSKGIDLIRMLVVLGLISSLFILDISNVNYYAIAWSAGILVGMTVSLFIFYIKYFRIYLSNAIIIWDKILFKKVANYSLWALVAMNVATLLSQIDMQMVLKILGPIEAGYYTNYISIMSIPFVLIVPIFGLIFPIISRLAENNNYKEISKIRSFFISYFIILALYISVFYIFFGENIAIGLFGEKYLESGKILLYSSMFIGFNFLLQINFNIMSGIGRIKSRTLILFIGLLINIILDYILIKELGVGGAALATGIGWVFIALASSYIIRDIKLKLNFKFILRNLIILAILVFILFLLKNILYSNNLDFILNLNLNLDTRILALIKSFIGAVFIFCIFMVFNFKIIKYFLKEIRNKK